MEEFKNILYPIALTDISPRIVPYVVTMAKQLDAQVHLLHVLRRFDWFVDTYVSDTPEPDFKRIASDFESQVLLQARQKLRTSVWDNLPPLFFVVIIDSRPVVEKAAPSKAVVTR